MPQRHQLVIDVADLLTEIGAQEQVSFSEPVPDLRSELARADTPVVFELTLESLQEGILVRGRLKGSYVASCRRCLEETERGFEVEVAELYNRVAAPDWESDYAVEGTKIDLDPVARDNIGLELPMFPLCRPDCKGICSACGANRNQGGCDCDVHESDERWAALRNLLEAADEEQ